MRAHSGEPTLAVFSSPPPPWKLAKVSPVGCFASATIQVLVVDFALADLKVVNSLSLIK
jgi:hypothetical protein